MDIEKCGPKEYSSAIKTKNIIAFATKWMGIQSIVLSEKTQIQKDKCFTFFSSESLDMRI